MKRNRWNAPRSMPAADLFSDDLLNAEEFCRKPTRQKSDRKLQQLCRQVQRTIGLTFTAGCGDPVLQSLTVESVDPAPDASRLMVSVSVSPTASDRKTATKDPYADLADLLGRLDRISPLLRREVAMAITRKRAPELAFRLVGRSEVQP